MQTTNPLDIGVRIKGLETENYRVTAPENI